MKFMLVSSVMLSTLVLGVTTPMMLALLILLQALILCLILFFLLKTSWFSYILFLIFLGGLMIIFSYMCSLASNEKMEIKINTPRTLFMVMLSIMLSMLWSEEHMILSNESQENIFKMISPLTLTPSVISMIYLLLTLIVIVKITNKKMGALRSNKN
uniref:NADH-ubiquinone oxidoreductase chain 6 n=1 Tax=Allacma fusca TaxID=39272 RepID=A0A7D5CPV2_9HEXA|nr:NADH dehydrogenase subunit 6 [Allacma fusca]